MYRRNAGRFLKIAMVLVPLLATLPLGATNAVAEPVELTIAGTNYMQVHLTGERQIQCTSKYHNVDLKAPFVSAFMLNSSQFNLLAPGAKVKPGDTWTADAFAVRFSDSLHRSKKYQPANAADKAALARWLGSSLREKHWEASGQMQIRLAEVTDGKAVLSLKGLLGGLDTGKMGSRYGPNNWVKNSRVDVTGKLVVRLSDGQVLDFSIQGKGNVDGVYYTSSSTPGDKFTATISLKTLAIEKLDAENFDEATLLIQQLGHPRYRLREKASRELEQLGPSIRMLLEDARQNNEDLEIRVRASRIIATFPKKPVNSNGTPPDDVLP